MHKGSCCYTVAKHGRCLVCRRIKSIPSTYNAFVASLELHGNKRSLTRKCWDVLVLPPCTLPSVSAGFVMFLGWVLSKSQSLCCMASCSLANATEVVQNDVKKNKIALKIFKIALRYELMSYCCLQMTASNGDLVYTKY